MEKRKTKKIIYVISCLSYIKKDKKNIGLYCIIGAIVGLIVAFSTPKIYKAGIMLAPETSNGNGLGTSLSSMASLVGLNKNILGGDDAIFPEIYPDLMSSTDFIVSLFPICVKTNDERVNATYYEYIKKWQKIAWWNYPAAWLKGLIKKIKKSNIQKNNDRQVNPFRLTKDQFEVAKAISNNIECTVDKKTSVISIEVTDQDPLIAATIADSVKTRLQVFITQYRTSKARNDLEYMEKLFNETKEDYIKAQQKYASFSDANQELVLQAYRLKEEELENDMQLRYNIYTQVAEQLQLAKSKVQETTPAFTVLQSATVPIKHSNRPKIVVLVTYIMLSFFIRICVVLYRNRKFIFEDIILE